MGTSKSFETPSGGAWTEPRRQLRLAIHDLEALAAQQFVRSALRALGGIGIQPRTSSLEINASAEDFEAGAGSGRAQTAAGGGRVALSGAVRGLGGFGSQVASVGLDAALTSMGLEDLRGRPAAEVIAKISEHLSGGADGRQAEILEAALREAIFDIAAIEGDGAYENLESSLQSFLDREGLEGFVEAFLSEYVFTGIWSYFENYVSSQTDAGRTEALAAAIEGACRSMVADELKSIRESGDLKPIDWFGKEGQQIADKMVSRLESGLTSS